MTLQFLTIMVCKNRGGVGVGGRKPMKLHHKIEVTIYLS